MAKSPRGFQRLPGTASLPQAITIMNTNFQQLFAYLEEVMGGLDALKGYPQGKTFSLNTDGHNPVVRNSTFNNPNDEYTGLPRDKVQFIEKVRTTEVVRIHNPEDESQWVDVRRITRLVLYNKQTGMEWVWNLGNVTDGEPVRDEDGTT
jgi:hypothetical protein